MHYNLHLTCYETGKRNIQCSGVEITIYTSLLQHIYVFKKLKVYYNGFTFNCTHHLGLVSRSSCKFWVVKNERP
jgi:hypothetical protein